MRTKSEKVIGTAPIIIETGEIMQSIAAKIALFVRARLLSFDINCKPFENTSLQL